MARTIKIIGVVILLVVGGIGAAIVTGVIQRPDAGVADIGDWGRISSSEAEIDTTIWVQNPNPVGISVDGDVQASYDLYLNDIRLATGSKQGISVPPGNNTVTVTTTLQSDQLPAWWVRFIRANETIPVRADPTATVTVGPLTTTGQLPTYNKTLLKDSQPVIASLSQVTSAAEGRYTKTVSSGQIPSKYTDITDGGVGEQLGDDASVTVGYEIRRGWATWGNVSNETTTVYFHLLIHNPGDVAVPAEPENLGLTVDMNGIEMFTAQSDDTTLRNPAEFNATDGGERVLVPDETKEVVYAVRLDNDKIDDWFTSHIRRGERTTIEAQLQLVFSINELTFRLPEESQFTYQCQLQTAILVDNQSTSTNCAQPPSAPSVSTSGETPTTTQTSTPTDAQTQTQTVVSTPSAAPTVTATPVRTETPASTPTPSSPTQSPTSSTTSAQSPTAQAMANQTEGTAPLTVRFNASASTDPNGDIAEYVWRFDDGTGPARGETVTHTFQTAGTYEVELTVIDEDGNRDTVTLTIEVNSRYDIQLGITTSAPPAESYVMTPQ